MSQTTQQQLGARIRSAREMRHISLAALARETGISRAYLYLIEKGESSPTQEKVAAIAKSLGVLVSELTGEIRDYDDLPFAIPDTLREFAEADGLTSEEVRMLSQIKYRGRQPQTEAQWRALFYAIRGALYEG
ncbi:MAG: helix-turn-helix transcriptional regulator [Anaerolineae bacterium]|nr:helix-turn-helix transcriptional regulator [Anaerolineae bacterium]